LKPKTSEQLGLYAGALKRALGWQVSYGYYLYGLKSGEAKLTPPLNLTAWTDELLGSIYIPANQQISAGIFLPNPGDACFVCSVSEHCAFVQALTTG
jgi:putative RecB family exonuclease